MTQPSNLKVKRLIELPALPPGNNDAAWLYAVHQNKDYKISVEDAASEIGDAIIGELEQPTGSSLVGYQLDAAGSVPVTIESKLDLFVTPQDFGAVGDGTADDTGALAAALATGLPVEGGGRTYRITSGLSMAHSFELRNCTIDMRGSPASTTAFTPASALVSGVALSGPVAIGATTLTLAGVLSVVPGQRLILTSSDLFVEQAPAVTKAEWVIVRSVLGSTITLEGTVQDGYSTSPQVYAHPFIPRVVLDGVRFIGDGVAAAQRAVVARRCDYVRFRRCSLQDIGSWGLTASDCRDVKAIDCDGINIDADSIGSYLVNFSGAISSAQATGITGRNYRHVVTAGGTAGVVQNYQVSGIIGVNCPEATADAHPSVKVAQFSDIRHLGIDATGALGDGVVSQALHTTITGVRSGKSKRSGILVQPWCHIYAPSVQVNNCTIQGALDYAVNVDLQYTRIQAKQIDVSGIIAPSAVKGILIQTGASSLGWEALRLSGNVVDSTDRTVLINANVACGSLEIHGGRYKRQNTTAECIQISNTVAGNVADIRVQGTRVIGGSHTVRLINPTGTRAVATGNILTGYTGSALNGFTHDGTTVIVANNVTA